MKHIVNIILAFVFLFNQTFVNHPVSKANPSAQVNTTAGNAITTSTPSSAFGAYPPPISPTPTPTSTPTPTQAVTPTPSVTSTPLPPTIPTKQSLELSIFAEPAIYLPGKPIQVHINVKGFSISSATSKMQMVLHVPDGVTATDKTIAAAITADKLLKITPDSLDKSISWDVSPTAKPPFVFSIELQDSGKEIQTNTVIVDKAQFIVEKNKNIVSFISNEKTQLEIPDASIDETLVFNIQNPGPNKMPPSSLTGHPIEIIAAGMAIGKNITKFNKPISIQISYAKDQLFDWNEESLTIFYYNGDNQEWYPLETTVDTTNKKLLAKTDHLTVFDYKAATWQANSLPSVDSFSVAEFTGAAAYDVGIWTPPGPAGFQPSIKLSYNSQIIDESTAYSQASWVGMGWTLDTGSITRNMHGTDGANQSNDDTFMLSLNGTNSLLLPIKSETRSGKNIITYNTSNQTYLKIENNTTDDVWTVYGTDGNVFQFGEHSGSFTNQRLRTSSATCETNQNNLTLTWRWQLSWSKDKNQNQITYAYFNPDKKPSGGCLNELAGYPQSITYGKYQITFNLEPRTDYQDSWTKTTSKVFYGVKRLKEVVIQNNPLGNWVDIRRFVLSFAADTDSSNYIYNGMAWKRTPQDTPISRTLTLTSIQEKSGDGNSSLPATSFTYGDENGDGKDEALHLTKIDNNQGGIVEMQYRPWAYFDDVNKDIRSFRMYLFCSGGLPSGWSQVSGIVRCDGGTGNLQLGEGSTHGTANYTVPEGLVKPGSQYRFLVEAQGIQTESGVVWGLTDTGKPSQLPGSGRVGTSGYTSLQVTVPNPTDYNPPTTKMQIDCDHCRVNYVEFVLFPVYYQVIKKTITDAVTSKSSVFTYDYDNASPNTMLTSEAARSGSLYTPTMREFRGNSMEQETNPDSLTTMNWFFQNDALKGSLYHSHTIKQSFYDTFDNLSDLSWQKSINDPSQQEINTGGLYGEDFDNASFLFNKTQSTELSITRKNSDNKPRVADGNVIIAQIRLNGTEPHLNSSGIYPQISGNHKAEVGIVSDSGKFFGFWIEADANGNYSAKLRYQTGSSMVTGSEIIPSGKFNLDRWYVVSIMVDSVNGFRIRLWQADDPDDNGEITLSGFGSESWNFREKVYAGTLWSDTYSEGVLFAENETYYKTKILFKLNSGSSEKDYCGKPENSPNGYTYSSLSDSTIKTFNDLSVTWICQSENISRTYGNNFGQDKGSSKWIGTKQNYQFAPSDQFGNLIHTTNYKWDGASWVLDHATAIEFFPRNDATKFLVSLPARKIEISCATSCDFTGATGLLAETLLIYDSNSTYNVQPNGLGHLAKQRILVDITSGQKNYSETGYSYDSFGNFQTITTYKNPATASLSPTDAGSTTTRQYDSVYHAYVTTETNALSKTVTTDYDFNLGLPIKVTDPNGAMEGAAYDALGRMIAVCEPGDWDGITCNQTTGTTLNITYTNYNGQANPKVPFNVLLKQKLDDSRFMQSMRYYNGLGKLLQTQSLGVQLSDSTKNTVIDYQYDSSGRQVRQTKPYAYTGSAAFQSQTFTAVQGTTTTAYDILSRVVSVTQADSTAETSSFGFVNDTDFGWSLQTSVKDAKNNSTLQLADPWGRVVRVTPPTGPGVKYIYNPVGQLMDTYYGTAHTQITYNYAGQKTIMADPDMGTWLYAYDYSGNLTTQTDAKHQRTCLYYDGLNRLIGKNYQTDSAGCPSGLPGSFTVAFSYDNTDAGPGIGRRTGMSDPTGSTNWVFDARGRVTSETKIVQDGTTILGNYITSWTYNSADQVVDMVYPSGEDVPFTYFDQGALNTVGDYVTSTNYDAAGRIVERNLGNGTKTAVTYNGWNSQGGRLSLMQAGTPASIPGSPSLQNLSYSYDLVGNITSIVDGRNSNQRQCFTYDTLNRLTRASTKADSANGCTNSTDSLPGNYDDSYTYDSTTGNLASKSGMGTYTYTDANHVHAVTKLNGVEKYTYDANGNMATRTIGSDTFSMAYDVENRLTSVTKGSIKVADYAYDGDGNRVLAKDYSVSQTNPDKTLYFGNYFEVFIDADYQPTGGQWQAPNCGTGRYCVYLPIVFGPPPLDGQVWKSYYYAGDVRVAMQVVDHDVIPPATTTSGIYYLYSDHLNSTSVTADSAGGLLSTINYKAWGETRDSNGTTLTTYLYTGQRKEAGLGGTYGLYFFNARWYDPALSRFTSPDSLIPGLQGVQAFNRYTYTNNNPLRYNDPSGHCFLVCALIGGVVGAIVGAAVVAVPQMIKNAQAGQPLTANIDPAEVGKAALIGAGAGAVLGGTLGLAAGALAPTVVTTTTEVATAGTGALKVVNSACGGDCTDELEKAKQIADDVVPRIADEATTLARNLGAAGEKAAQIIKNTVRIPSLTGTANYRIPDQLLPSQQLLSEVKNVSYLSYTNQIKDFLLYSQQQGYRFELFVRQSTVFSDPLQQLINNGSIITRYLTAK